MKLVRQGDVLLRQCDEQPKGEIKKYAQLTVQLGEATGHHHTLYPNRGTFLNDLPPSSPIDFYIEEFFNDGKRFMRIDATWLLRHQEHRELRIEPGTYEIVIEKEYDPFEESMKKVVD